MLRKLLTDRFQLKFHTETRDAPVVILTVGKNGLKAPPAENTPIGAGGFGMAPMFQKLSLRNYALLMGGACATLEFRPVVDGTGLEGEFDLRMETQPGLNDGIRRTLIDQLCENVSQLGLELRRQEVPLLFYIIDSVAREPTAN